ncbi:MAG: CRISPR-associated endonuclease Cas3'' [Leptothrix sp. (in: Bacteria)]|jgi:CRISPR-associated endonuclease/helicase Cas3|nr:CRISPR-associated endonuclease Cas3'' [Leptothrix sp. (in: b-proteobacteria)]
MEEAAIAHSAQGEMRNRFAHSENEHGRKHLLRDHLNSVATMAGSFAALRPWREEASLAGLAHDLGKYGDLFQQRLEGLVSGLDHWSAGATLVATDRNLLSLAAALAIEGHHVGLCPGTPQSLASRLKAAAAHHPLGLRLSDPDFQRLRQRAQADGLHFTAPKQRVVQKLSGNGQTGTMLDIRLLFSCLVDADFMDTESHFQAGPEGKRMRAAGPDLQTYLADALACLDRYMAQTARASKKSSEEVRQVRDELWEQVSASATGSHRGLFTMTAPTGSGKTLAMLQFAMRHAERHGLNRIVLAVPYLSIIEQTARIYRKVFAGLPEHFILEHHSLAGLGPETVRSDSEPQGQSGDQERQRRLLAENWDAPIILTTNVQLLESLFSNRPSSCRKLHRLMDAVILFDEAQSLPQELTVPTLATLSHLSQAANSSIVFATATQPAFDHLDAAVRTHAPSGWQPREIIATHASMFKRLDRVKVEWPEGGQRTGWAALADQLAQEEQVLCIVNLKRHAHELARDLDGADGLMHLSTNLCTSHRREVLTQVRQRLSPQNPQPCRLIATQCIEAGVDVDFPVVYRALAPLEAIAQAAGRCNREGRLQRGRVVVFEPESRSADTDAWRGNYPGFSYWQAAAVTRSLGNVDIHDPASFRRYYQKLFDLAQPALQNKALDAALRALDFPEVARLYRLIENDAIQVVVPWSRAVDTFTELRRQAMRSIDAGWMREAQALAVAIYRPAPGHPVWGYLMPARLDTRRGSADSDEWFILEDANRDDPQQRLYDDVFGLRLPDSQRIMIA